MDLGRAFNYPLKDPNWIVKLLIGAVLSIVTLGILPLGYSVRVMRNVMRGDDAAMPEWDDFGGDLVRGIMLFIAYIVYSIPIGIVYCCIAVIGSGSEDLANILNCLVLPVVLLYFVAIAFIAIPSVVNYAATDNFSEAFLNFGARFREATANINNLLMLIVYIFIVQFVMGIVAGLTIWICGLGLLASFAGNVMVAHLIGQYGALLGYDSPLKRGGVF